MSTFKETFGESVIDFTSVSKGDIADSFISSGSRCLNRILTGHSDVGVVHSRIYELYGTEGSGKTTIALASGASCHHKKGKVLFIDVEHALDQKYAEAIGVDFSKMEFAQPSSGEEAFKMIIWGIENKFDLIIVDSVAALTPIAELEGDMDTDYMGIHARLMGKGLRKVVMMLGRRNPTSIIFINQIRSKIGVMYGNPETTPGGRALKFFSAVRIEFRDPRGGKVVEDGEEIGKIVNAKTVKNKVYAPFKKCKIHFTYGLGVDKMKDLAQALTDIGKAIMTKKTISIKGYKMMNYSTFADKIKTDKKFKKIIKDMLEEGNK